MSTVRVTLPRYNQSWSLPRDRILSIIPESLIGQALEEEPDVPEIVLENPDVTPEAMQVIANYLEGREPQQHIPSLVAAARYLNMLWLNYYVDPMYDQVIRPTAGDNYDSKSNRTLLVRAAETGHNWLIGYLLLKGVNPVETTEKFNIKWSPALDGAIKHDNLEGVKLLLSDPRVMALTEPIDTDEINPEKFYMQKALAIDVDAVNVYHWLIQQIPNFNYRKELGNLVNAFYSDVKIVNLLLDLAPDIDTTFKYLLIKDAADYENKPLIREILKRIPDEETDEEPED